MNAITHTHIQVCTLSKFRSLFWDPLWRIHGLCCRLPQWWIRQWAHNIIQPRSLRRRQCLRQLISTLTRRVETGIHCCLKTGTVTFGFLWTLCMKSKERESSDPQSHSRVPFRSLSIWFRYSVFGSRCQNAQKKTGSAGERTGQIRVGYHTVLKKSAARQKNMGSAGP